MELAFPCVSNREDHICAGDGVALYLAGVGAYDHKVAASRAWLGLL